MVKVGDRANVEVRVTVRVRVRVSVGVNSGACELIDKYPTSFLAFDTD